MMIFLLFVHRSTRKHSDVISHLQEEMEHQISRAEKTAYNLADEVTFLARNLFKLKLKINVLQANTTQIITFCKFFFKNIFILKKHRGGSRIFSRGGGFSKKIRKF